MLSIFLSEKLRAAASLWRENSRVQRVNILQTKNGLKVSVFQNCANLRQYTDADFSEKYLMMLLVLKNSDYAPVWKNYSILEPC